MQMIVDSVNGFEKAICQSKRQRIMVSEFLTPTGRLHLPASTPNNNAQFVTKSLEFGNGNWWTGFKLFNSGV